VASPVVVIRALSIFACASVLMTPTPKPTTQALIGDALAVAVDEASAVKLAALMIVGVVASEPMSMLASARA